MLDCFMGQRLDVSPCLWRFLARPFRSERDVKANRSPDEFHDVALASLARQGKPSARDGHHKWSVAGIDLALQARINPLQQVLAHSNEAGVFIMHEVAQQRLSFLGLQDGMSLDPR
jgi:hypothetical protein